MSAATSLEKSSLERKILSLQERLKAENEANKRNIIPTEIANPFPGRKPNQMNRPRQLCDMGSPLPPRHEGTPTRSRKGLALPLIANTKRNEAGTEVDSKMQEIMKLNGIINIHGAKYQTEVKDLEHLGELGNGTCGHVVKMLHKPSSTVIAVKQMRRSGNVDENKRIIMDIDVVLKSHDCPYIVQCLGCFITDADVWICMELMATCFDKLLRRVRKPIPENILGKVTVATVNALHYLKESHGVIHRDVKPSNILLDERGNVKLCDFGISGRLVDSKAKTRSAGCAAYMAPERIDPPDPTKPDYDIRADVWSLGITLVELATGHFPYRDCKTDFEVLTKVLQDDPPRLPTDVAFGAEFQDFVTSCLTKNYRKRPKYRKLLEHPFIQKYESAEVDVAAWFALAMKQSETVTTTLVNASTNTNPTHVRRFTPPPISMSSLPQASPTPPRRHGTFNHAQLQPSNHQRHHSVPDPISLHTSPPSSFVPHEHIIHTRGEPPAPPQRIYPAEHIGQRKRHPSEPPHPTQPPVANGNAPFYQRFTFSPPPTARPTSPLARQDSDPKPNEETQKKFASYFKLQLERTRPPPPNTYPPNSQLYSQNSQNYTQNPQNFVSNPQSYSPNPSNYASNPQNYTPNPQNFTQNPQNFTQNPQNFTQNPQNFTQTPQNFTQNPQNYTTNPQSYSQSSQTYPSQNYNTNQKSFSPPNTFPTASPHPLPTSPALMRLNPVRNTDRFFVDSPRYEPTPSPPPRLNRLASEDSPRLRRGFLDATRRSLGAAETSPSLSRRYVSPTPPQPPPRRLSESTSVPGSPQHSRVPNFRARYHYTPEPQRRVFNDFNDL